MIDNWRWAGIPFYLRTGKRLTERRTEIAIRFHDAPLALFRSTGVERLTPNWLILRIQPDEGIALEFAAKHPGLAWSSEPSGWTSPTGTISRPRRARATRP
jgi:glucose-6-phosphate 1-dehydrogenase